MTLLEQDCPCLTQPALSTWPGGGLKSKVVGPAKSVNLKKLSEDSLRQAADLDASLVHWCICLGAARLQLEVAPSAAMDTADLQPGACWPQQLLIDTGNLLQ